MPDSNFSPEQIEMLQQMLAVLAQNAANGVPAAPALPVPGAKPQPLDIESKRIYLRISDQTDELFRSLSNWLKESGFRIQDRRPKAQVLLHILTHEFAKLTEEEKRNICRPYMD
jgi:outer membrane lipopolysaccharide assembly protein LptE/RlpB